MLRRSIVVVVVALSLLGLTAAPALAGTEICPYVGVFGKRYMVCIPLP
jgi:hypothetical protein